MKVEIMEVTPATAREWLASNTENRPIKRTAVDRYRADMAAGSWQLNGEAIVMNGGKLIDGQHRLLACVEADLPFKSIVVFDAPETAMQTIDQGVSRTFADVLRWKGYNNQARLASAVRVGWRWDNGVLMRNVHPTATQMMAWLGENERITSAVQFAGRVAGTPIRLPISASGALFLKAIENNEDAAIEFFDRMLDGEHLSHGQPLYALRRTLISNAMRPHGKIPSLPLMAMTIKAWNAWVLGAPVEKLTWRTNQRGERFPVMLGVDGEPISAPQ